MKPLLQTVLLALLLAAAGIWVWQAVGPAETPGTDAGAAESAGEGALEAAGEDAGASGASGSAQDEGEDGTVPAAGEPEDKEPIADVEEAAGTDEAEAEEDGSGASSGADPASAEVKAAILLVNKEHPLSEDYVPDDLVVPNVKFSFSGEDEKKKMQREAAEALERLFTAAEEDGIELRAVSGYRSYARQKAIFEYNARMKGEKEANRTSARPGESEHQTGLAMDVSAASVNYALVEAFGETIEGIWLAENAPKFGFIIRYPPEKEEITGYKYEPWHLRYVGEEVAQYVTAQGLTLEEYLLGEEAVRKE